MKFEADESGFSGGDEPRPYETKNVSHNAELFVWSYIDYSERDLVYPKFSDELHEQID